jgi:hypothetical protein
MTPRRFLAILTRNVVAEMLTPSYAHARNVDLNEAALRLVDATRDVRLLAGIQEGTWLGLREKKPKLEDDEILELVLKKLERTKRFKAFKAPAKEQGGAAAVLVLADVAANMASGDAAALIDSADGARYLEAGFRAFGRHFADELLR